MQIMGHAQPHALHGNRAHQPGTQEARLHTIAGARILLVEDNDINQLVACELLTDAGFAVDLAENGLLAVQNVEARHAEQLPYDLVLMDMQMPVMDGITASRQIRENHAADRLPIVAMTANAMQADRERCMQAGMNGFVTKPIDPEELWGELLRWIQPRASLAPPDPPTHTPAPDPAPLQSLRSIQGLDVAQGLLRTSGNAAFYVSLLKKFAASQHDALARMRLALQAADWTTAERHAHTLKGLAATLGAEPLQQAAGRLETALHEQADATILSTAMARTGAQLDALVQALNAAPELMVAAAPLQHITPADRAAAGPILEQIKALLRKDDPQAAESWQAHAALLRAICPDADLIEAAIAAFSFEDALELMPD
jgi:CheY-like chemotaxis protein